MERPVLEVFEGAFDAGKLLSDLPLKYWPG